MPRSQGLRFLFFGAILTSIAITVAFASWLLWPRFEYWWVWNQYQRDFYDADRFQALMKYTGEEVTIRYSSWYISAVFRARRGKQEPYYVVQLYNGTAQGFNLGQLVILGTDGRYIQSIMNARIQYMLLTPDGSDIQKLTDTQKQEENHEVIELPDLDGDGYSEIPTQRWSPREATAIYRTNDKTLSCVLDIEFYDRWPVDDLAWGFCYLNYSEDDSTKLKLVTPIYVRTGNGHTIDRGQPLRQLAEYKWSAPDKAFRGPAIGPKGVWKMRSGIPDAGQ